MIGDTIPATTEYVWIVHWGNYDPPELFAIYSTEQMARDGIEENETGTHDIPYEISRYTMNVWGG